MIDPRKRPLRMRPCHCGCVAEYRRQNTAYADDKQNFAYLCDECQLEADELWDEMWADYYSGIM